MMESTQVLELTQTLEASQATEPLDSVPMKVGCLKINGVNYFVWNKENTIGRDENCDIVIENKAVSVEHAVIEADAFGKHLIWDLGSTNKTRLGEVQLKPRVRHYLNDGARLRFANVNAVYHHIKVISPQKPPIPQQIPMQIPGTPERAEEDAAAIDAIVAETPRKSDENDGSSDGDFFGEHDSSALFMRPLKLLEDGQNHNCPSSSEKQPSLDDSEMSASSKDPEVQLNPVGQAINESSVCEADTSVDGEADNSDVIAGSQPLFFPKTALNIYEVDTVPMDRVEETPVKASKNDVLNWEDLDDSIHEISQEMDTIDSLIENKELCVKFTPPKRVDSASSGTASTAADNHKPNPPTRNFFFDDPPCDAPLHVEKMNMYDVETEPLQLDNNKMEAGENIFDLATQDVPGSKDEGVEFEADISVYDLATQQFLDTDNQKPVGNPNFVVTDSRPSLGNMGVADVSISDLQTQVADTAPKGVPEESNIADVSISDVQTQVAQPSNVRPGDSKTQVANDDMDNSPVSSCTADVSMSDLQTQVADTAPKGVPEESNVAGISISDLQTQVANLAPKGVPEESNIADVSISDVQTQVAQPSNVRLGDTKTQVANDGIDNSPVISCTADVSMSDLQTQIADTAPKGVPEESNVADISISDLPTQVANMPQNEVIAGIDTSVNHFRIPNLPTKESGGADGPESEDIYNVLTQMPVSDHQIMYEESDTEKIELEVDGHEKRMIDSILENPSDCSSRSLSHSVSPLKADLSLMDVEAPKITPSNANDDLYLLDTQAMQVSLASSASMKPSDFEHPKTSTAEEPACKPAQISVYDVETEDPSKNEEAVVPAGASVYDVATQDVGYAEKDSDPAETSVYGVETQVHGEAKDVGVFDVATVGADAESKSNVAETLEDKEASVQEKPTNSSEVQIANRGHSQDIDANSVENRIMAMNDKNVSAPIVQKESLNTKTTVAELLETLEGTPLLKVSTLKSTQSELKLSESSGAPCSQFPAKKSQKKVKVLNYTDSEDSNETPLAALGKEKKSLSEQIQKLDDSDPSQSSNARCSQFPVEKARKKVKTLVFSDTEDSCDSPLIEQKRNEKPLEVVTDKECAIHESKEEEKTVVVASPGLLCNGNSMLSKDDPKGYLVAKESELPKTESPAASAEVSNNGTGDDESLRLQLSDVSTNCTLTEDKSRDVAASENNKSMDHANGCEANMSVTATPTCKPESKGLKKESVASLPKESKSEVQAQSGHTPPKSKDKSRRVSPQVSTPSTNPRQNEKAGPDTPDIPRDFFGTPLTQERPPLRQYVNKKKLSLDASSLLKGPNASSTPRSDEDSHSVIDMEETLLTAVPKIDGKTAKKVTESSHRDDDSQDDTPKNVKKFRKSPVKKPSHNFQLFSQDNEILSSQEELADSQDLGRGKRRRVKKSFFGFDDNDDSVPTKGPSPKPCSSVTEMNIATSSKVREDSTAQPILDISPVVQESLEAETPRRERPRKQAFMSCESNEARNTMERYKNDACYAHPQKSGGVSSGALETIVQVHQASVEPESKRLSAEMDLARLKNSLKASLARGQESANSQTVEEADVPKSPEKSLPCEKSTPVPDSDRKCEENESLNPSVESEGSHILTSPIRRGRGRPPKNKSKPPIPDSKFTEKKTDVEKTQERIFNIGDVNRVESPVKRGRGRKRDTHTEPSGGAKPKDEDITGDKLSGSTIEPGQRHSPSKGKSVSSSELSISVHLDVIAPERVMPKEAPSVDQAHAQDLNNVPKSSEVPSRGRRRKEKAAQEQASEPSTSSAGLSENTLQKRQTRLKKNLLSSQDSQPELSQHSQSSVSSKNGVSTRRARNTPLTSQGTVISESTNEQASCNTRRKVSAGSQIVDSQEAIDDVHMKMPAICDEGRVTHESDLEPNVIVAENSATVLQHGKGRSRKPVACSTPVLAPAQEHSPSGPIMELPTVSKSRPDRSGLERNVSSQLSQDSQPEESSSSSKRGARKRGNVDTTKSTEKIDQLASKNKKLKINTENENLEMSDCIETVDIRDGASNRSTNRRGAEPVPSGSVVDGSPRESQSSSGIVSTIRRRGNRNATETPQPPEDDNAEVPAPKETVAASPRKPRGRPRKALRHAVDDSLDSLPAPEELSATEVPNVSKTRGRRKKVVEAEEESQMESATEEVSATEVPTVPKTRGRPRKVVATPQDEDRSVPVAENVNTTEVASLAKPRGRRLKEAVDGSAEEDGSSQDLSQGRRSGRARKKKESFDELVSRKEEEIRLKKLQRSAEQSPSPDKSHRSNLVTPSASVASISDESAFSVPASPASSITGKRSASRLGSSTTESLPSSSKKRKEEDLLSTPSSGQMKVMFTQLDDSKLSAMVKKLGGKVVEKPTDCSVLVTDKVKRTVKFLCALGLGKPIVSPNWVSKSKAFSKFVDPNECLLKDNEGETKFNFELSSSLEKAKSQRLLEGYSVYTTASILPTPKEMKPIIECSGGTFWAKPPAKWRPQSVVISDPKDKSEWPKLTKNGVTPPILSAEAILAGVLQQRFDLEKHRLK